MKFYQTNRILCVMNKLSQMGIEIWQERMTLPGAKVNHVLNAYELLNKGNGASIFILFEQFGLANDLISNIAKALNADCKSIEYNNELEKRKNSIKIDTKSLFANPTSKSSLWQQIQSVLDSYR